LAQARRIFDPCATVLDTCLVPKRLLPQHCSEEAVEGRFELGGRVVQLGKITCPMLNVYVKEDHIIPPVTSQALGGKVGSSDYAELGLRVATWAFSSAASAGSAWIGYRR
jgi:poly(3-hydroxyalkanoate) synthetase